MRSRFALALLPFLLVGCQTLGAGGGLPKAKPISAPLPTVNAGISGGGLIGGKLGASLDAADKTAAFEAEYKALEYSAGGELVAWAGKNGTASGKVTAAQPYRVGSQDCRQYRHEVTLNGAMTSGRGSACRNSDGTWTLLE
jgi:surface antigen